MIEKEVVRGNGREEWECKEGKDFEGPAGGKIGRKDRKVEGMNKRKRVREEGSQKWGMGEGNKGVKENGRMKRMKERRDVRMKDYEGWKTLRYRYSEHKNFKSFIQKKINSCSNI